MKVNNNGGTQRAVHLPWLDAVRFMAALLVLLGHTRNDFFVSYDNLPADQQSIISMLFYFFCRLGHEAVIAFFVISGFLVGGKGLEKIKSGLFNRTSYVIDRVVRIGLPLIAAIIFCFITNKILGLDFSYLTALGNLFSLQGILCDSLVTPFWSLSFEVWFYVILFGISLVSSKRISGLILIFLCCLVFTQLDAFYLLLWFMGAFAYLCKPQKQNKLILWISFLAMWLFVALSIMASDSNAIQLPWKPNREAMEVCITLAMCLFIQQVILCNPTRKITVAIDKLFSKLANFSYTLYLTHRITLLLVFEYLYSKGTAYFDMKGILSYICILLICLISSWLIYLMSERHTAKVKKVIKNKILQ